MSVLNVCTTDLDNRISRRYRYRNPSNGQQQQQQQQHQQLQSPVYRRFSWNYQSNSTTTDSFDNYSFYTSSSRNSSFEVIFSRLLDALIFTSAIAITAYSYLTGTLVQPFVEAPKPKVLVEYRGPPSSNNSSSHRHHHHHHSMVVDPIEDSKRKRTQEWAEQQVQQPAIQQREPSSPIPSSKKRSCSSTLLDHKKVQPISRDNMKREKKRTQSLPVNQPPADDDSTPDEKEDELISRLQSLIQQGQDALSSPVKYKKHSL